STLTVSGGGTTATYTWQAGGSVVGTGSSLSVSPATTTTYQVECTSCGSCTAVQVTLTVTPLPPPSAQLEVTPSQLSWSSSANSQVISVASNVSWSVSGLPASGWLTASAAGGSGSGSFTLTAAPNPTTTSRTAYVVVSSAGLSQTITVSQAASLLVDAGLCSSFVNGAQVAYRSVGDVAVKVVVLVDASGCRRAVWSNAEGEVPRDWLPYITANAGFTLSSISSCLKFSLEPCTTATNCNLVASASPNNITAGLSSTLTVSGGSSGSVYTWKSGGIVVGTGSSLTVSPNATMIYQVECSNCGSCTAAQVTVAVNVSAPTACTLTATALPASIAAGMSSTLTVNGGGSAAAYSWKVGGSVVGTGSSLSVSPGSTTTYQVECTNCGSCSAAQVVVTITTPTPSVKACPGTGSLSY
ncbi:BACON domain-containing protein, partial [Fibrella sp. HMF5335]